MEKIKFNFTTFYKQMDTEVDVDLGMALVGMEEDLEVPILEVALVMERRIWWWRIGIYRDQDGGYLRRWL